MELYEETYQFLKSSGYKVSKRYFKERMQAHPDYPALNSFTDLLDEFEIDNQVIKIEKESSRKELPKIFLIHFIYENGQTGFRIIKKDRKGNVKAKDFLGWTGITILIAQGSKINDREHREIYEKETHLKMVSMALFTAIGVVFLILQFIRFEWVVFISFLFAVAGFFVSILIVNQEMGSKSKVSEFFCKTEGSGCSTVLNSKYGKWGHYLNLGDLTVVYFAGTLLFLSVLPGIPVLEKITLLLIVLLPGLLSTPFSIFYQVKLRSFCRLCLSVLLVLWGQAIHLFLYFFSNNISLDELHVTLDASLTALVSFSVVSLWLLIKPKLIENQKLPYQSLMLRKWRQNPSWFDALLPLHKKIDTTFWEKEIFYGNRNGVLQFLIVSNPYCEYCAVAHMDLEKILDKHPKDIGVRIRFHIKSKDQETSNDKYNAILRIIRAYEMLIWDKEGKHHDELARRIITDWYELDELNWTQKYKLPQEDDEHVRRLTIIHDSITWCNQVGIQQTPSFFINGYEMPNPHTFKDLFLFVSDYIEILRHKEKKTAVINSGF